MDLPMNCVVKAADHSNRCHVQKDNDTSAFEVLANPFNISPMLLPIDDYAGARRRYRTFVLTRFSFITDALTGAKLDVEDQCVPIKMQQAGSPESVDGHATLMKAAEPLTDRDRGTRDVCRNLITADAAGGKTVMMRQLIHGCCKWKHRDQNDAVPILILVIDLQRSMAKHAHEYEGQEDLVAVFLRLQHKDSDRSRYLMLMQAYDSRRALLLLDGIDEGGDAKGRIEEFITTFLVRQRVPLIVTSRPEVSHSR